MLGLVRHVGAEVAANDAVPSGVVFLVELLLHELSNVLLDIVLLKRLRRGVNSFLLHVLGHVSVLDHSLALQHTICVWFVELISPTRRGGIFIVVDSNR